jgi:hypothetical protein
MSVESKFGLKISLFENIQEMQPFFAHGKIFIKTDKTRAKELMQEFSFADFSMDAIDTVVVDLNGLESHALLPHLIDSQNNKYEDRFYILRHLSDKDKYAMNTCEALSILSTSLELVVDENKEINEKTTIGKEIISEHFIKMKKIIKDKRILKYNETVCNSLIDCLTPTDDMELNLYEWSNNLEKSARTVAEKFYDLYCRELLV